MQITNRINLRPFKKDLKALTGSITAIVEALAFREVCCV